MLTLIEKDIILSCLRRKFQEEKVPRISIDELAKDKELITSLKLKGAAFRTAVMEVVHASNGIFYTVRGRKGGIYFNSELVSIVKDANLSISVLKDIVRSVDAGTDISENIIPQKIIINDEQEPQVPQIKHASLPITTTPPVSNDWVERFPVKELNIRVGSRPFLLNLRNLKLTKEVVIRMIHNIFAIEEDETGDLDIDGKKYVVYPEYKILICDFLFHALAAGECY